MRRLIGAACVAFSVCVAFAADELVPEPELRLGKMPNKRSKGSDPSVYVLLYMLDFDAADVVDYAAS